MNTESPLRIAVIGAGLIGRRHIQHIMAEPRCQLAGVVEPNPAAKTFAEHAGTAYFSDIESFLKEGNAEAVIIATPNVTHAPIGIKCAEAGLHLFVEKPIDSDLKAATTLVEAANKAGVKLLIGHHRRFNAYIEATKRILEEGRLGTITAVNVLWTVLKPPSYFEVAWRREPGGGPVFINLIHDIDNLRYLFGNIERIYAESSNSMRRYPVEETAVITIRFCSGVLGTVLSSDVVASPYNFESATGENPLLSSAFQDCYRIFGTKATLSFPDMTLWYYSGEGEPGWEVPISYERIEVERTVPFENQLRHFCDVVCKGVDPRCSGEEGLKTLETTLAASKAMCTGIPVMCS
ncbi:probable Oxidoreductase [Candidatus Vecturithrix granuli]|uniref:Probable Oxidoreductase n=1 Tax=Vecturithrix granuli TaxID=1499967 RepID=A0A081C9H5_VECG1|nr:probable Oxidoreductase [Candidatus Vecturithrix granuli]